MTNVQLITAKWHGLKVIKNIFWKTILKQCWTQDIDKFDKFYSTTEFNVFFFGLSVIAVVVFLTHEFVFFWVQRSWVSLARRRKTRFKIELGVGSA